MLEFAQKHREALETGMLETWGKDRYRFYNAGSWFDKQDICDSTWDHVQYASVSPGGEVTGYLGYRVNRESRYVTGLEIVNFTDRPEFGFDVLEMVREIFEKYNYRKMEFSVITGNPAEAKYDRLVRKYGGRIVGVYREHVMLFDGRLYDEKLYEVFRKDYMESRKDCLERRKGHGTAT